MANMKKPVRYSLYCLFRIFISNCIPFSLSSSSSSSLPRTLFFGEFYQNTRDLRILDFFGIFIALHKMQVRKQIKSVLFCLSFCSTVERYSAAFKEHKSSFSTISIIATYNLATLLVAIIEED